MQPVFDFKIWTLVPLEEDKSKIKVMLKLLRTWIRPVWMMKKIGF
jgi:hypothetical protein